MQKHLWEFSEVYTPLHNRAAGERTLQTEDMLPMPVADRRRIEPMVPGTLQVRGMVQHAGALKQNRDVEAREALEHEWPEVISHIMNLKNDIEGEMYKMLMHLPGRFRNLKREGAYPCMYQIKVDGRKVYKVKVLWDAGKAYHAKFLTDGQWYDMTGHALRDDTKGDLIECICFFGAISPYYPDYMKFAGLRSTQGWCRALSRMATQITKDAGGFRTRPDAAKSLLDEDDDEDDAQDKGGPKCTSGSYPPTDQGTPTTA